MSLHHLLAVARLKQRHSPASSGPRDGHRAHRQRPLMALLTPDAMTLAGSGAITAGLWIATRVLSRRWPW